MTSPSPSTPPLGAEPGGIGPRIIARIIDVGLLVIVAVLLGVVLDFGLLWLVLYAALSYGYYVVMDTTRGATFGKKAMGLSIRGAAGGLPTPQEAAVRELVTVVGAVPFIGGLLSLAGWIAILVTTSQSPTRQGIHDRMAGGTQVVAAG